MKLSKIIDHFKTEMINKGIVPPSQIMLDGQLHRFHIEGDNRASRNGWYVLYTDNIPSGAFGNWKTGINQTWSIKASSHVGLSVGLELQRKMVVAKKLRDEAKAIEYKKTAALAKEIYDRCHTADPSNPYLLRKRIKAFCAHQLDGRLVLPIIDTEGNQWSLQFILSNGDKRFLSGGAIKGHFIPIQNRPTNDVSILICEGFATGATLAQVYSDTCVIAACNANNLRHVAVHIRDKLPSIELIICADADEVGLVKAREAAKDVGGILRAPKFPKDIAGKLTDFNDLFCLHVSQEMLA
ncbi:hypothetical protein TUM19329_09450 [Legionella antarctica]|uniref:Toprim domain-containing protein n=1 Tax=Legionella antarctica TaxID=2708020 RepID=A0A6F8T1M6_9GAMM|nr:toprim domain-containing protein [Legionella antarctica]BCA94584.1 hypothetical protein TUM19329_09450 [Legionella antarctica]